MIITASTKKKSKDKEIVLLVEVVRKQGMVWCGGRLEEESPIRKRLYTVVSISCRGDFCSPNTNIGCE